MSKTPGGPGIPATWSASRKDMIGCALGSPRLWYTLSQGIVNEVYYPRVDIPQIRDLGFMIADDEGFWVEIKQHDKYEIASCGAGAPVVTLIHRHPRFTLRIGVCPDPRRDVLMLEVALEGDPELQPYVLLAPRLGGSDNHNEAWYDEYHGRRVLWASQGPLPSLWLPATNGATMPSYAAPSATSARTTGGRISPTMGLCVGHIRMPVPAMSPSLVNFPDTRCSRWASAADDAPSPRSPSPA